MALIRRPRLTVSNPNRFRSGRVNALRASGYRVKKKDADTMRRLIQPWQTRAFSYYNTIPEIKYGAQFYSRSLSVLRLYIAQTDPKTGELVESTENVPNAHLDRIQDPGGGRSGLLAGYGRLMFLTGEGYLLVTQDPETGAEQWEMLSTDELRVYGSDITRFKAPSLAAENFRAPRDEDFEPIDDRTAIAYRLWKRHPQFSSLADSTMQGVLEVCEELSLLTHAVRARARSRLAGSGILLVNEKISPPPAEAGPDEDPLEDPLIEDMTQAFTAPIIDESAASAVVPLVVRVGGIDKLDDAMKHIQIVDPTQLYPETGLRRECVERLAIGLDMPPEILLGLADSNHWSAWQVDEQTWKAHLQPVAQQLVDDLTSAFLRPQLHEEGFPDWETYCVAYDASAIINHPDRTKDAKDLYDRRAIGKKALRDASGFEEEDAPTEDELNEMIGIATRDSSLAVFGIPSIKAGGLEPSPGEVEKPGEGTVTEPTGPIQGADVEKGPPSADSARDDEPPGSVIGGANGNGHAAEVLAARILGASDLALYRARELAGNKLRNYAKRDAEALRKIDGVRASEVGAVLGREAARELGAPAARELVVGAHGLIADAFRLWGIDATLAEPIGERIEQHAAQTLYDERPGPLPPSFGNYVYGLTAAKKS